MLRRRHGPKHLRSLSSFSERAAHQGAARGLRALATKALQCSQCWGKSIIQRAKHLGSNPALATSRLCNS